MNPTAMLRAFCDAVEQHDGAALAALGAALKTRPEMKRHLAE
jgi:hypothetical protein